MPQESGEITGSDAQLEKIIATLRLSRKAGAVTVGTEAVKNAPPTAKVYIASDTNGHRGGRVLPLTKMQLGDVFGRETVAVIAVTNPNLAEKLEVLLLVN